MFLRSRSLLLVSVAALAGTAACAAPEPSTTAVARVEKPTAAAKVTSSALTLKATSIKTWQVYRGYGQTTALGFDAKGRPVDGIRFTVVGASGSGGSVSFKTMRRGGELVIDDAGHITKNTMKNAEMRVLYGGSSVLSAFADKASTGSVLPKSLQAISGAASDCGWSALAAVGTCGKLLRDCIPAAAAGARTGAVVGGLAPIPGGLAAGTVIGGVAGTAACVGADKLAAAGCGGSGGKAYTACSDYLKGKGKAETAADKAAPNASTAKPGGSPSSTSGKDPAADPNAACDPNDQACDPNKDPSAKCTDTNDPACDAAADPNAKCADANDPACDAPADPNATPDGCTDPNDPACGPNADPNATPDGACTDANDPACSTADTVDPNADPATDLDPNPNDPEVAAQPDAPVPDEPQAAQEPSASDPGVIEASVHFRSVGSTSKSVAVKVGGACRAHHVLQCGGRTASSFCRCVPE